MSGALAWNVANKCRTISNDDRPPLLLDEMEALRENKSRMYPQAILAVLNAGHRKGATVPRCDGPKNELKFFAVYGPKAWPHSGGLPDTLADSCVCLTMHRKNATHSKLSVFFPRGPKQMLAPFGNHSLLGLRLTAQMSEAAYGRDGGFRVSQRQRGGSLDATICGLCRRAAPASG